MNQFEELQTFIHVVDTGSISRAAERMTVAKSAVSRRISDLEHRLGVQLFRRTTRQLNLTDSGRSFYERATQILSDLEEAELAVSQQHSALTGRLRIAAPLSFGLSHLGPAIIDFNKQHPDLLFDVDFNDRKIDILEDGFDMAIRIAQLTDSSLIARRIAPIHQTLCASPEYLKHNGTPKSPDELQQHKCLLYSNIQNPHHWSFSDESGNTINVKVPVGLTSNNGDFLRDAAIAGQGLVKMPNFILYKSLSSGELVPLLSQYQSPSFNAYAIYPQTRHLSYRVRAFVDFLVDRFEGHPYWDVH
ncbi:LysR family transcriptional regulator [Kaarinaea lacus]